MIQTRTFCDLCGHEFKSNDTYWDSQPCTLVIKMSAPAQSYENFDFEHICKQCRQSVVDLINQRLALKPKVLK